jgi:hypothetical protein
LRRFECVIRDHGNSRITALVSGSDIPEGYYLIYDHVGEIRGAAFDKHGSRC